MIVNDPCQPVKKILSKFFNNQCFFQGDHSAVFGLEPFRHKLDAVGIDGPLPEPVRTAELDVTRISCCECFQVCIHLPAPGAVLEADDNIRETVKDVSYCSLVV